MWPPMTEPSMLSPELSSALTRAPLYPPRAGRAPLGASGSLLLGAPELQLTAHLKPYRILSYSDRGGMAWINN